MPSDFRESEFESMVGSHSFDSNFSTRYFTAPRLQIRIVAANGGFTQVEAPPLLAAADVTGGWSRHSGRKGRTSPLQPSGFPVISRAAATSRSGISADSGNDRRRIIAARSPSVTNSQARSQAPVTVGTYIDRSSSLVHEPRFQACRCVPSNGPGGRNSFFCFIYMPIGSAR